MSSETEPSPIETLLAGVLDKHEVDEPRGYAFVVCSCGTEFGNWQTAREHQAFHLADVLRGDALVETVEQAIYDIAVDHHMWIDNQGQELDYHPEREARIGDFIQTATRKVIDAIHGKEDK